MPPRLYWCRIDPEGPGLHAPKLAGDVGWDLELAKDGALAPGAQTDLETNVRIQLPSGHWGEIRARSSIARMGLQVDAGVLDNGYTGPLFVLLRNMNTYAVELSAGMRVAQLVLHRGAFAVVGEEVAAIKDDPRRGNAGFGSTGGLQHPAETDDPVAEMYKIEEQPWGGQWRWRLVDTENRTLATATGFKDPRSTKTSAVRDLVRRGLPDDFPIIH